MCFRVLLKLLDCYLEAYHHVLDITEKNRLAQVNNSSP